jgi:hypothetical protein
VDQIIADNKVRYSQLNVDFRILDIIEDNLPDGDVAFVRQVLQHLSNADIAKVAPKLAKFKYLVLTEEIPAADGWQANADKMRDQHIRLRQGSGVVLTAPPFSLQPVSVSTICAVPSEVGAILKTDVLTFATD